MIFIRLSFNKRAESVNGSKPARNVVCEVLRTVGAQRVLQTCLLFRNLFPGCNRHRLDFAVVLKAIGMPSVTHGMDSTHIIGRQHNAAFRRLCVPKTLSELMT
jgi:hypothetical protein